MKHWFFMTAPGGNGEIKLAQIEVGDGPPPTSKGYDPKDEISADNYSHRCGDGFGFDGEKSLSE